MFGVRPGGGRPVRRIRRAGPLPPLCSKCTNTPSAVDSGAERGRVYADFGSQERFTRGSAENVSQNASPESEPLRV